MKTEHPLVVQLDGASMILAEWRKFPEYRVIEKTLAPGFTCSVRGDDPWRAVAIFTPEGVLVAEIPFRLIRGHTMLLDKIKAEAVITVEAEIDDAPLRGNVMASGDEDYDRRVENRILRQLQSGNVWAWASVTVTARWAGLEASDHLGCCSYKDEAEFRNDGYFHDMVAECCNELVRKAELIIRKAGYDTRTIETDT